MKKLKVNQTQFALFTDYVLQCIKANINTGSDTMSKLLAFHLRAISQKICKRAIDLQYSPRQSVQLSFNEAEASTLAYMFKKIQVHPYLMEAERKLLEA